MVNVLIPAFGALAALALGLYGQWRLQTDGNLVVTGWAWGAGYVLLWVSLWWERWHTGRVGRLPIPLAEGADEQRGVGWLLVPGFACVWGARLLVRDRFNVQADVVLVALLYWAAGVLMVLSAFWAPRRVGPRRGPAWWRALGARWRRWWAGVVAQPLAADGDVTTASWPGWELLALGALTLVAFGLRIYALDSVPWLFLGDEGSVGQEAQHWITGFYTNPFVTGWSSHPMWYFMWQSLFIRVWGASIFALRLSSVLVGTLSVPAIYVFVRRYWGRAVAWATVIILSGMAFHIHWSRISLDPVYDPLFSAWVLGGIIEGLHSGRRAWFLWAAVGFAIGLYFWGSRLLAIEGVVLVAYYALFHWRRLWRNLFNGLAFSGLALALTLPLFLQFYQHPDDFYARMNQLGVYQLGWVARSADPNAFLWDQFMRSVLAFNFFPDVSPFYHPGIALFRPALGVLLVVGIGWALWHWRRPADFTMLTLLMGAFIFGGMLMKEPPQVHHFVIGLLPAAVFVALALVEVGGRVLRVLGARPRLWAGVAVAAAVVLAADDANWYFNVYSPARSFGDANTELAHVMAMRLRELQPGAEYRLYFFGPPRMWAGFPSVPYLAPDVERYDVEISLSGPPAFVQPDKRPVFVFLPERRAEADLVALACPGGQLETVMLHNDINVLFYWYVPSAGCYSQSQ